MQAEINDVLIRSEFRQEKAKSADSARRVTINTKGHFIDQYLQLKLIPMNRLSDHATIEPVFCFIAMSSQSWGY